MLQTSQEPPKKESHYRLATHSQTRSLLPLPRVTPRACALSSGGHPQRCITAHTSGGLSLWTMNHRRVKAHAGSLFPSLAPEPTPPTASAQ